MPRENKLFLYQTQERKYSDNATYFNIEDRTYIYDPLMVNAYHWHDYFEMEFFCEGEGTHILNGETLTVRRGSIHLLTPADFHTLYKKEEYGELKYFNVNFNCAVPLHRPELYGVYCGNLFYIPKTVRNFRKMSL